MSIGISDETVATEPRGESIPRISIAMASYNGVRYLEQQLDSLARQTLLPMEVVVSDDGSTDTTLGLLADYAREAPFAIRILPPHERLGFADNFLHAAAACEGDFVALCDQDDVWLPHKLATGHARLVADDSLLAMHRLTLTDDDLTPYGIHDQGIGGNACFEPLELDPYVTGWGNTMLFRRELATLIPRDTRPRQPEAERPLSHDTWLYVLAAALGRVSHVQEALILYRQHGGNVYGTRGRDGRVERLRARLDTFRTVPLTIYRERAIFDAHMARLFADLAGRTAPPLQCAALRAAERFDERGARWARRVRLYECKRLGERIAVYREMLAVSPANGEAAAAKRRAVGKDLVLGVAGIGIRR